MSKVLCPSIECKYNKNQKCTCKEIRLTGRNMATVNEGRVDVWICNQYEIDEYSKYIFSEFLKIMENVYRSENE